MSKKVQGVCRFFDHGVHSRLTQKRKLAVFIPQLLFHYLKRDAMVSYTFVSDEVLHEMNLHYLQHDTLTDIITFDLSESSELPVVGDIYISIDRVKENARSLGVAYPVELLRVILHGALHLAGFGDSSGKEKKKMRELEEHWMNLFLQTV